MLFALGFLLFLLGFAMFSAAIGLFIGGDITLKSGKKIPKAVGRKAGFAFVSFFPLVAVIRLILNFVDADHVVPTAALYWPLGLGCLTLGSLWLLQALSAGTSRRRVTVPPSTLGDSSGEPVVLEIELPGEPPPAPIAKPSRGKPRDRSPFDFS